MKTGGEKKADKEVETWLWCCLCFSVFIRVCSLVYTFDTHSGVHLLVLGYWRCCQRRTGSYGWSLEGSAFLCPDDRQPKSLHISNTFRLKWCTVTHGTHCKFVLFSPSLLQHTAGIYCGRTEVNRLWIKSRKHWKHPSQTKDVMYTC